MQVEGAPVQGGIYLLGGMVTPQFGGGYLPSMGVPVQTGGIAGAGGIAGQGAIHGGGTIPTIEGGAHGIRAP